MIGPLFDDGGAPILSAGSGDIADETLDPSTGAASLKFETDGDRIASTNLGTVDEGDWITPKAAAAALNGQCTIRAHVDSSTGSGLNAGSSAVDSDLALSTERIWIVTQAGVGSSSATITFTIKFNGVTMHSVQRTISATVS